MWCWVEDLGDDAAFMELVTSNNQGELSPLEIGIHALKAVPKAEGGRGKKGGLSEYAERIGKTNQYVGQLRQAAEVAVETSNLSLGFMDRTKHLAAIHKLPRPCWRPACEWLAAHEAPVSDVEARVAQATSFRDSFIPDDRWQDYLPLDACAAAVFCGTEPANFQRPHGLARQWSEAGATLSTVRPLPE